MLIFDSVLDLEFCNLFLTVKNSGSSPVAVYSARPEINWCNFGTDGRKFVL